MKRRTFLLTTGAAMAAPHRAKIAAMRIQTRAHAIDVPKRGKELERFGKKTSAVE